MRTLKPGKPTKLYSRLGEIAASLPRTVDEVLVKGAGIVADDAELRVRPHRLSGALEGQIVVDDRKRAGVYVHAGDPKDPSFAFYGHMIEHGTSHSPPFPFLVPALEANADRIEMMAAGAIRGLAEAKAITTVKGV